MPAPKLRTKGPKALKTRHMSLALMLATDMSDKDIAKALGITVGGVQYVKKSPLCKLEVARLKRQQADLSSRNYVDQIMEDGDTNVRFLRDVRDGKLLDEPNTPEGLRVRLSASIPLLDRQAPKQTESNANNALTIVFQRTEQREMAQVIREANLSIPQLDDVIADFKRAEDDAATTLD